MGKITDNYKRLRDSVKEDVVIVVATKTRNVKEIDRMSILQQ